MATVKQNLEDFVTCSVCLERFDGRDPRFLPCGHAFCLTCIQNIHRTATNNKDTKLEDGEFRCPQCTTISKIPENSVNNYPKFFYAAQMQDALTEINKGTNVPHYVASNFAVCAADQREITGYCFNCCKPFCEQCLCAHNETRRYTDHLTVDITKDDIQSLVCRSHQTLVEAYCTDCCQAVCAHCQVTEHSQHSISDFVIKVHKPPDTTEITQIHGDTIAKIRQTEVIQKEFNDHINQLKAEITDRADHQIAQINARRENLHAVLARHQADTNREMETRKEHLGALEAKITNIRAQIAQLTQPLPNVPSANLHNIDDILSNLKCKYPSIPVMNNVVWYQFDAKEEPTSLGALSIRPQLVNTMRTDADITDICWTPSGELLVAAGKLVMYNERGELLPVLHHLSGVAGPVYSVAVHQSTVAFIAGDNPDRYLYITSLDDGHHMRRVCKLNIFLPKATFTADGNVLVGGGKILRKYTTKGTKLWEKQTFLNIDYITTSPDNHIIISGDNQLSVHDQQGRMVSPFFTDETLKACGPAGVCTDSRGRVFMVDSVRQAVEMYTSSGSYVKDIMGVDGDTAHLALHHDRYMAVCLWQKLVLYDLNNILK